MWRARCPPDALAVCEMTNSISCNPALPGRKLNPFIRITIKQICPHEALDLLAFRFRSDHLGLGHRILSRRDPPLGPEIQSGCRTHIQLDDAADLWTLSVV